MTRRTASPKPSDVPDAATLSPIVLPPVNLATVQIPIVGDTSLITNAWSERAKEAIRKKQRKDAQTPREARNPQLEYEESRYVLPDGRFGHPAGAFKRAAVEACRLVDGLPMTEARVLFHVLDELVAIEGEPKYREDVRVLASGVWDPVYRAEYFPWAATLTVRYHAGRLSLEQLINLFNLAGLNGVGCWRPSSPKGKSGNHGMFHVATSADEITTNGGPAGRKRARHKS